jgi:hypothetical protein
VSVSNLRDQPELNTVRSVGHNGSNGTTAQPTDPAHTGALPNATLPELVGRLINDVSDLADRQIDLAKQEISEAKTEAIGAVLKISIGAGIAIAAALLFVIWAWTGFIWFFNWVGAFFGFGGLGWLLGAIIPPLAIFIAYRVFIRGGIQRAKGVWPPLGRTRETLKEDLEWLRQLRTRSAR